MRPPIVSNLSAGWEDSRISCGGGGVERDRPVILSVNQHSQPSSHVGVQHHGAEGGLGTNQNLNQQGGGGQSGLAAQQGSAPARALGDGMSKGFSHRPVGEIYVQAHPRDVPWGTPLQLAATRTPARASGFSDGGIPQKSALAPEQHSGEESEYTWIVSGIGFGCAADTGHPSVSSH